MSLFSKPAVILQMFEMLVYWLEQECNPISKKFFERELEKLRNILYYDFNITFRFDGGVTFVDAVFQPTRTTQYVRARSSIIAGGGSKIFYVVCSPFIDDPYNLQWVPYDREARKIYQVKLYDATPPIWDVW